MELIAFLESNIDSQLELKEATDNLGNILCTLQGYCSLSLVSDLWIYHPVSH